MKHLVEKDAFNTLAGTAVAISLCVYVRRAQCSSEIRVHARGLKDNIIFVVVVVFVGACAHFNRRIQTGEEKKMKHTEHTQSKSTVTTDWKRKNE